MAGRIRNRGTTRADAGTDPSPAPEARSGVSPDSACLPTYGLFAGIGGFELGLARAGHPTLGLCENDPGARAVLAKKFPRVPLAGDVRELKRLPPGVRLLTAGFPCQDISQAGTTRGLAGDRSGLVSEVFRLLRGPGAPPNVLIENVSFMRSLGRGAIMRAIRDELEVLGYRWAYRTIDSRAFGLPQRRERIFLLASRELDPTRVLFSKNHPPREPEFRKGVACGFYWTEGNRGLGFAVDAVPTIKGGSGVGVPSPPAIWMPKARPDARVVTPHIRDAERMQGFPAGWTEPAEKVVRAGFRWKLVGNAVTVDVAKWIGLGLARVAEEGGGAGAFDPQETAGDGDDAGEFDLWNSWPPAAHGRQGEGPRRVEISAWPAARRARSLGEFLKEEPAPLSVRALGGFLSRLRASGLRHPEPFLPGLEAFLRRRIERE